MKKPVLSLKLCSLALSLLFVASCRSDREVVPQTEKTLQTDNVGKTLADSDRHTIALALAYSLQDPAMRVFMKTEALKKFDGDYDVLYKRVANTTVDGISFTQRLASGLSGSSSAGRVSATEAVSTINQIASQNPLLNFALAAGQEKWNPASETALVAVLPANYDEATT